MPSCHVCGKHHADLDSAGYCCYKESLLIAFDEPNTSEDNTRWLVYSSFYGSYMTWTPNQFMTELMPAKSSEPAIVYGKNSAEELARKTDGVVQPYVEVKATLVPAVEELSEYW